MKLTFRSKLIARTTPGLSVRTDRPMAESANVLIIPPCVHGGMISTLADSAMGRSVRTLKPGVVRAMSFDLKVSFISAAKVGETLRATARVIHGGRRTAVTECRIEGPGGRLVATASGTFAVTREKV